MPSVVPSWIGSLIQMLHRLFVIVFALQTSAVSAYSCGIPVVKPRLVEARIIGGTEAIPGSWPWTVALYKTNASSPTSSADFSNSTTYNCVGALIDKQTVVTAAHCLTELLLPAHLKVLLGVYDRTKREAGSVLTNASQICIHPEWIQGNRNDIGLIRLSSGIRFTRTIQAVCLPSDASFPNAGDDLFVTGWGITSPMTTEASHVLKQARQTIIARDVCSQMGRSELDAIFCAGHEYGSTCKGDSGGPLVRRINESWQLDGIVSAGPAVCGASVSPLYYTQVFAYNGWIRSLLKNESFGDNCLRINAN